VSIVDHLDDKVKVHIVNANFFLGLQLRKHIQKQRPDIIHTHLRRSARAIAKLNLTIPSVSTLHIGINGDHFLAMDGLICNARWQVEQVPAKYKGRVFKANNSIVPHRKLQADEIKSLREELAIGDNCLLIGAVGRYHTSKAWDTLIKAVNKLKTTQTFQLLFFGVGSQEGELKRLAADNPHIRFIGYRKDIKDLYQCFDFLVCPSRFEPLPRVMLEAMDAGTPVIASDIGGCKELIEDYGGETFRVEDDDALCTKLSAWIENPPARNHPDLSPHYIENANAATVGFYRELIAAKTT